jgi:HlyD family secretion protein
MKGRMQVLLALLLVVGIGGAGYLGMRSVTGEATPDLQAPSTVEVTRGDVRTTVTAPGHLVYVREAMLSFGVGGTLARVDVRPGDQVPAGAVLAQLDPAALQAQVRAAQAGLEVARARLEQLLADPSAAEWAAAELALASAEARLRELEAGPSAMAVASSEAEVAAARKDLESLKALPDPSTLAQAQAQFDKATVALQQAQAAYDLVKSRADVGMLPQTLALQQATIEYEAAQANLESARRKATPVMLESARARLAAAEASLEMLKAGPSADELAIAALQKEAAQAALAQLAAGPSAADLQQAQASVEAAERALEAAQADLDAATLTAPFAGVVLEIHASPGEMVAPATGLVLLAECSALEVEATVIEEDLPLVQVGQEAELFFDAQPEAEVQGYVVRIIPQRVPGDRPLYPVYIAAPDLPGVLLAGMTADASIVVDSRHGVLRLPRAVVRTRSDGTATVQVWSGTRSQERSVRTGLRGDAYVEILEGLDEGEQVVAP